LVALEIDDANLLLVPATVVPHGQVTGIAPSAGPLANFNQRLVRPIGRQVVIDERGLKAQRRRYRSVCFDSHRLLSWSAGLLLAALPVSPDRIRPDIPCCELSGPWVFVPLSPRFRPLSFTGCSRTPAASRQP